MAFERKLVIGNSLKCSNDSIYMSKLKCIIEL